MWYQLHVIIDPPVSGKDLIGRERDMENLWDEAENGSVLLISPRCFGKTVTPRQNNFPLVLRA